MTISTVPLGSAAGLDRPVRDVMHAGQVTVEGSLPLAEAARTMAAHRVHAVLVCDAGGAPLGWVTTRGLLHNLPREWAGATAREAITEQIISVAPSEPLHKALEAFLASGASHILVRAPDDPLVLGVVAESDLLVVLTGGGPAADEQHG